MKAIDYFCLTVDANDDIPPLKDKSWLDYRLTASEWYWNLRCKRDTSIGALGTDLMRVVILTGRGEARRRVPFFISWTWTFRSLHLVDSARTFFVVYNVIRIEGSSSRFASPFVSVHSINLIFTLWLICPSRQTSFLPIAYG